MNLVRATSNSSSLLYDSDASSLVVEIGEIVGILSKVITFAGVIQTTNR